MLKPIVLLSVTIFMSFQLLELPQCWADQLCDDDDGQYRKRLLSANDDDVIAALNGLDGLDDKVATALKEHIIRLVVNPNPKIRTQTARLLRKVKEHSAEVARAFQNLLDDKESTVLYETLSSLSQSKFDWGKEERIKLSKRVGVLMQHQQPILGIHAAKTLLRIDSADTGSMLHLRKLLAHPRVDVQCESAKVIAGEGRRIIGFIMEDCKESMNPQYKLNVIDVLGVICVTDSGAVDQVVPFLARFNKDNDPNVRKHAAFVLMCVTGRAKSGH